jgi:Putative addiction module component
MAIELPVKQMTVEEKLHAMDVLWADLRSNEENIPVPQWHKELLAKRERLVQDNKATFSDWEAAKKRIAKRIREN